MDKVILKLKVESREGVPNGFALIKGSEHAAGLDICSSVDMTIEAGNRELVPTGIYAEVPPGYEIQVRPRSGMAYKHKTGILNSPGTIDADYRGEIKVMLINLGYSPLYIKAGDRIAQLVVSKLPEVEVEYVQELSDTTRGEGGFGSTGIK